MPNMGAQSNGPWFDMAVRERIAERERVAAPLRFAAESRRASAQPMPRSAAHRLVLGLRPWTWIRRWAGKNVTSSSTVTETT